MKECLTGQFFQLAMEGVADSVRQGTFSTDDAVKLASAFVREKYPNAMCAFLFGSAAKGSQKAYSDLDVLVITPRVIHPQKRCLVFCGFPIELYTHNRLSFEAAIDLRRGRSASKLLAAVLEGSVLLDNDEGASTIRKIAKQVASSIAPGIPNEIEFRSTRAQITSLMIEVATNSERGEAVACAAQLYLLLLRSIVQRRTGYPNVLQKWAVRKLREVDRALADQFQDAFALFVGRGERAQFLHLCERELMEIGGPLWHGFVGRAGQNIEKDPTA